jgi:hypothetical protein
MYPDELSKLRATVRHYLNDGTTQRTQRELIDAVNAHAKKTKAPTRLTLSILNRLFAEKQREHRYATVAVLLAYVQAVEAGKAKLPAGRPLPPQPMVAAATRLESQYPGWAVHLRPAGQVDHAAA